MNLGALVRIRARPASELCQHFELGQEALTLLGDDPDAGAFLERLLAGEYYDDAVRFLAHALPKREAVWWGCLCLGYALNLGSDSQIPAALQIAVRWVVDPSELNRRAAESAGEGTQLTTPIGCVAMAAFWSGGRTQPPVSHGVSPPEFRTAKAVADGILLAAAQGVPTQVANRLRQSLALGIGVANDKYLWQPSLPPPDLLAASSTGTATELSPEPRTRFPKRGEERK